MAVRQKTAAERLAEKGLSDLDSLILRIIEGHLRTQQFIESLVSESFLSGNLGVARYRRRQQREARLAIEELGDLIDRPVSQLVREAFRLGTRVAERGLNTKSKGSSRIDKQAVNLLTKSLSDRLDDVHNTILHRISTVFRQEGLKIASSRLGGQEPESSEFRERIAGFQDRAGRYWDLDVYAQMITRTVTSEAMFQGTQTRMLSMGLDLVRVNHVRDSCTDCLPYDGKTFSLTGRSNEHPKLEVTFPIHPLCRHFITPDPQAVREKEGALG